MIKLALPAGDLRSPTAELLEASGLQVDGYDEGSRSYLFEIESVGAVRVRVFREKDIPVQVALGNYDLGICSWAWVAELKSRFASYQIIPLFDLGLGASKLYAATSSEFATLDDVASLSRVRIASEYPNIAEQFARGARMRAFRVQPVAGAAEAYPPEDADLVLVSGSDEANVRTHGLNPLFEVLRSSAWLIANRDSVSGKDLASVVRPLLANAEGTVSERAIGLPTAVNSNGNERVRPTRLSIRMAVPDGHQQRHAASALADAGIQLDGYEDSPPRRRPGCSVDGLDVKVIRPQDMPHLIATGELDIAITGRDCLREHLYSFPSSPVEEVADLQRGQYNLCAVVSEDVKVDTIGEAMAMWRSEGKPYVRIAAEFPATADHYARSRHIWRYRVIPIAGASEGFVPEDAELLIEGTETGRTLRENNLKSIDQIYRSTTCVIARKNPRLPEDHASVFGNVVSALQKAGSQADHSA
ncbi:MAG: ATP phosphoribosyltransferase [Chloroflexi bacterium]|nr:ATP phosphoribosyltransferase [Chloroflexota bacterium]